MENNPSWGEERAGLELAPLASLTSLTELQLAGCGVAPCSASVLEALSRLHTLSLPMTRCVQGPGCRSERTLGLRGLVLVRFVLATERVGLTVLWY
jgi:hypothetical protein